MSRRVSIRASDEEYKMLTQMADGTGCDTPGEALHLLVGLMAQRWKK